MIWHIFRKDWRLHWKFAALLAVVQLVCAAVVVKLGPFMDNRGLRSLLPLLILATLVGVPFLIAAVVHGDAIPGERQDWLVRPIRRGHLMAAKFLFILLAVHVPMFAADLGRGLANGFGVGESAGAAAAHGIFVLLSFSVPVFAFVSLTRNFMEAIVAGLLVFVILVGFLFLVDQTTTRTALLSASAMGWIPQSLQIAAGLIGAGLILGVQYFRRRTITARGVGTAAVIAAAVVMFLPWNTGFAVERGLSSAPGTSSVIAVALSGRPVNNGISNNGFAALSQLLRFDNLPPDSLVHLDRAELRFRDTSGSSTRVGFGQNSDVESKLRNEMPVFIRVPGDAYEHLKGQSGGLELGLWMTLFRHTGSYSIPALGGRERFTELGQCTTEVDGSETNVRLGCSPLEDAASCVSIELRHVPSGRSNGRWLHCDADYTPYFDEVFIMPGPTWHADFRDISGRVKYNVDGPQLGESRVFIETYQPVDHFSRTITAAATLRDWLPQ